MKQLDMLAFVELMQSIRDLCHKNSVDHGFWDEQETTLYGDGVNVTYKEKPWNFGEKIALIHSELSEMFEAWRKGIGDKPCDKDIKILDPKHQGEPGNLVKSRPITNIEEEVADVFIRLMDLCGKLDIDVGRVVLAKHEYNKSREHMHNRKC